MKTRLLALLITLSYFSAHTQTLVKDIWAGNGNGLPTTANPGLKYARIGNYVYFVANDSAHGNELWRSDGTPGGTNMVADINPGTGDGLANFDFGYSVNVYPTLYVVGNNIYFAATDGTHGFELWRSDGTQGGTYMVKDIYSGSISGLPLTIGSNRSTIYASINDTLYFAATDGINGLELWRTDGTQLGTRMVKDIRTGTNGSYPNYLVRFNNLILFSAYDSIYGQELWKSDGTAEGTVVVADINTGNNGANNPNSSLPYGLITWNGAVYFTAYPSYSLGDQLFKTDGTEAGTVPVKLVNPTSASGILNLTPFNGALYFSANDGTHGYELWKTTGTTQTTTMVADIWPGSPGSTPSYLTVMNNKLYFSAYDSAHGNELWSSDGTAIGTQLVNDNNTGTASSSPSYLCGAGNHLYFAANDGTNGVELWQSDGAASGTFMMNQIYPGLSSSYPMYMTYTGSSVIFMGTSGLGAELWAVNDVTGIEEVAESEPFHVYPNPGSSYVKIAVKDAEKISRISFYNLQGKMVKDVTTQLNSPISTAELATGMYFIRAYDKDNNPVGVQKWVKD